MQAKDFFGLTKEEAMKMDVKNKTIHCTALKVLDDAMLKVLSACSKELQETLAMAVEVCSEFAKSMNATAGKNATKGRDAAEGKNVTKGKNATKGDSTTNDEA